MPGGLAGRCTTIYASPPKFLTEGVGVEPTGASKLRQFSGLLGVPGAQPSSRLAGTPGLEPGLADLEFASLAFNVRPFVYASGRTRTSMPRSGATALQAAA